MAALPSYTNLAKEYLDYVNYTSPQVSKLIGGKVLVNNFPNTCAVRLSRTLNYNSLELPKNFAGLSVVSGDDKKWYAYRVKDIRKWLSQKIAKPGFDITKKQNDPFDKSTIASLKGIIGFDIGFSDATGHLDLWDGMKFTSEHLGTNKQYWAMATRIWIWKTT